MRPFLFSNAQCARPKDKPPFTAILHDNLAPAGTRCFIGRCSHAPEAIGTIHRKSYLSGIGGRSILACTIVAPIGYLKPSTFQKGCRGCAPVDRLCRSDDSNGMGDIAGHQRQNRRDHD